MSEQAPPPERLLPNEAQEQALRNLCERYQVEYSPDHYFVNAYGAWMLPGYAEGYVGGTPDTIYVGCSPEGQISS